MLSRKPENEERHGTPPTSGAEQSPLNLGGLLASWQERTPYPQFLWFGIWCPDSYEWAQQLIAGGPEVWRQRGAELARLTDWEGEIDPQGTVLVEACARGEMLQGQPWVKEYLAEAFQRGETVAEGRPLKQYLRDCGNFFHLVAQHGLARAAVIMADDESHEKYDRRTENLHTALCRCVPKSEDRLRLLEELVTQEQDQDIRTLAIQHLPELSPAADKLAGLLKGLANDPDDAVRFWAAFHLSRIDPTAPWLVPALMNGFWTAVTSGYDTCDKHRATLTIVALERVGPMALREATRQLASEGRWEAAAACCLALGRYPGAETIALVTDLMQQLLTEIPANWFESRRLRRVASDLLERAAERLRSLCWKHYSELEYLLSGLLERLSRLPYHWLPALLWGGGEKEGRSMVGSLRGVHLTLQGELAGYPEALTSLEEIEHLLREAEVALTQILQLDESGRMDPIRMEALRVLEETLASIADSPSARTEQG